MSTLATRLHPPHFFLSRPNGQKQPLESRWQISFCLFHNITDWYMILTAAKILFIRFFRHTRHIYTHTVLGWFVWVILCVGAVAIAFIFATAVPIFSYLIGISAALFASWYTYGLAGFFWLYDVYHLKEGYRGLQRRPGGSILAVLTIVAGGFMCIAGTYVSVKVNFSPLSPIQYLLINIHLLLFLSQAYQRCISWPPRWEAV
jgi:hypothetical protein